jgi:ABC-type uncharacterized transport system ATPase subunit
MWGNYIYNKKNHVDFKYVYFQIFLWKKKNLQDIIVVQMYEIMKIQMHFQSNYFMFLNFLYRCVDLGKILKNEIYLFSFGQSMKKKMVKIGDFCMGQRMM